METAILNAELGLHGQHLIDVQMSRLFVSLRRKLNAYKGRLQNAEEPTRSSRLVQLDLSSLPLKMLGRLLFFTATLVNTVLRMSALRFSSSAILQRRANISGPRCFLP